MKNKKDEMLKNYFWPHFIVLKIFGADMEDTEKNLLYKIYSVVVIALFFYIYIIVETVALIQTWDDLGDATFTMSYLLSHFIAICKITLLLMHKKRIHTFSKKLEMGNFVPDRSRGGDKEFEFVREAIKAANLQGYFFHVFVLVIVLQRYLYALLDPGKDVTFFVASSNTTVVRHVRLTPFSVWLPFEPIETPLYEIACIYQTASCMFFGFIIGASDAIIGGIYAHVKAQILILKNVVENYLDVAAKSMKDDGVDFDLSIYENPKRLPNGVYVVEKIPLFFQKFVDVVVRNCVEHHQDIIELAEGAENTFNYLMLVQFLGSLMLICFQLFQLSLYEMKSFRFFSMISYLILMLFQLLLFCWRGNEVELASASLPSSIYGSNWLVSDLRTQKSMILMMTRAQRPIRMTAGKFAFLSLDTFMTIIRGSGSYFMVLRNFNEQT